MASPSSIEGFSSPRESAATEAAQVGRASRVLVCLPSLPGDALETC